MLFDDAFLDDLKANPIAGTISAIEHAQSKYAQSPNWTPADYQICIELLALLEELEDSELITVKPVAPDLTGDRQVDCKEISAYAHGIKEELTALQRQSGLDATKERFRARLGKAFAYEFSQGDLDRVQTLLNELRDQISAADFFEPDHQRRLLKRLEKLQGELHKKVADLDRFWGLVGDAGVAMGKFGTNAKPIVDRIREIAEIVWQTQAHAEELPSGTNLPSLGHDSGEPTREA